MGGCQTKNTVMRRYSANKILILLAVVMGGAMSVTFIWAGLPKESATEILKLLAEAVGAWIVISSMTFAMLWFFYKLIVGIGRYIHDRFYRTPTL